MIARRITFVLPTGRRVRVRADLSVRVMLRSGLIRPTDEEPLLDALDDVGLDDRAHGRRLQDAIVLHALGETEAWQLDGFSEPEFMELLRYGVTRLTATDDEPAEDDEEHDTAEAANEAAPKLELDEELAIAAAREDFKRPAIRVPPAAEVVEADAARAEEEQSGA